MITAVLFDLDDTLLGNHVDSFLPRYFTLLGKYAQRYLDADRFLQEMMICTQQMMANTDTAVTNRDVFWNAFQQRTGLDPVELEPFFDLFYREQFPQLASIASKRPAAREMIHLAQSRGWQVVVATHPVFPRTAVLERLKWAGLDDISFDLITTYENMHTTKPHHSYYQEILDAVGETAETTLMVGDDWENDIEPAAALGMHTFWITNGSLDLPPDLSLITGYGTLDTLFQRLQTGVGLPADWLVT